MSRIEAHRLLDAFIAKTRECFAAGMTEDEAGEAVDDALGALVEAATRAAIGQHGEPAPPTDPDAYLKREA